MPSAPKLNLEVAVISLYDGVRVGHGHKPQVSHLVTKTPLVPVKSESLECAADDLGFEISQCLTLIELSYRRTACFVAERSIPLWLCRSA